MESPAGIGLMMGYILPLHLRKGLILMALGSFNDTINWRDLSFGLEAKFLGGLALLDLMSTLYLMHVGVVVEANPILAPYAAVSPLAFVVAKLLLTIPQLVLLECIARRHPKIVRLYGRLGIAAYALVYVGGSLLVNHSR